MKAALFRELYELAHKDGDLRILANVSREPDFSRIAHDFSDQFIDISANEHSALSLCEALIQKQKSVILCVEMPSYLLRWFEHLLVAAPTILERLIIIGFPPTPQAHVSPHVRPEILLMHAIARFTIITPATQEELGSLLAFAHATKTLSYFHFHNFQRSPVNEPATTLPRLFEPVEYAQGRQCLCIGIGSGLKKAYQARLHLEEYGYSTSLISFPTVHPLNEPALRKYLHAHSAIFVFEEDELPLGIGTKIGNFIAENLERKIVFKSFHPIPGLAQSFDFRTITLEILDLMTLANIIPDGQSWIANQI